MALEIKETGNNAESVLGVRKLDNKQQIFSILSAVQKSRTPITIKFENSDKYFTSIILKVDLERDHLIIDEIAPAEGHTLAMHGLPFSIRGNHSGVNLFFRPNVISGSGIENNIAFYSIPLPGEMVYQQRRNAFRALVPRALNAQVSLYSEERNQHFNGRLFDISIGGCRINFAGEISPEFIRSEIFERVSIRLPDGGTINNPLKLKHASYIPEHRETTCGFEFLNMDKAGQRTVDRFVYFLQREARRLETK